jgi:hypothetical protein
LHAPLQVPAVLWQWRHSRVRYDNERGKGDHRPIDEAETPYTFITVEQLLDDFERDVAHWRPAS